VAHAQWLAHHARHDPKLLHDHASAAEKQHLMGLIESSPRHSHERHDRFAELHRLLDSTRRGHATDLASLDGRAAQLRNRFHERAVIYDRTWPFALYPQTILRALRDEVRAAFSLSP
jgi:hypothetical protein